MRAHYAIVANDRFEQIAYMSRLNSISAPVMPSRQAHAFGVLVELLGVFESDGVPEVVLADEKRPALRVSVPACPSNWKKTGHERIKCNLMARFLLTSLHVPALKCLHLLRGATEEQGKEKDKG